MFDSNPYAGSTTTNDLPSVNDPDTPQKKKRGRKLSLAATDSNVQYVAYYLKKKYSSQRWVEKINPSDPDAVNLLISQNLSKQENTQLKNAIRKNNQYSREAASIFPPSMIKVSGEARGIIDKLARSEDSTCMSDLIVKYLGPITALSSSEREQLIQQLQTYNSFM